VVVASAAVATVITIFLTWARWAVEGASAVTLILAVSAALLAVTSILTHLGSDTMGRSLLPVTGILGVFGMAIAESGFASESLYWAPIIPFVAMLALGGRGAIVFGVLCQLATVLLFLLRPEPLGMVLFHWLGLAGALMFGTALGLVTERSRHLSLTRLDLARSRLQAVVDNLQTGVAITDDDARLIVINQKLCDDFGVTEDPVMLAGRSTWPVIKRSSRGPAEPLSFAKRIVELARQRIMVTGDEVRMRDGRIFQRDFVPVDFGSGNLGHLWSYHEITSHRRKQEETLARLHTDPITGLGSRARLDEELDRFCAEANMGHHPFALLYLDLDGFKAINDEFGHAAGDKVLTELGSRMLGMVRKDDVIARIGGDEFAVILSGVADDATLAVICRKFVEMGQVPIDVGGESVTVGVSVGAAPCAGACAANEILDQADRAMYQAKDQGKNRFVIANEAVRLRRPDLHETP